MRTPASSQPVVFNMSSGQCIWARAGVIGPTACINAFNCLNCPVDRRMQIRVKNAKLARGPARKLPIQLKETMNRPYADQKCRHMLSGRIASKICVHDFDCMTCTYHQMMDDENLNLATGKVSTEIADGFELAANYYYHPGHVWARVEYGGRVRIGMDDFAARLIGRPDGITLPDLGDMVFQGKPFAGISRGSFTTRILCPLEGIVVAKNPEILKSPGLITRSPYQEGWIMVLEPLKLQARLKKLLFQEKSYAWLENESSRLAGRLSGETSYRLAATGGRAIDDIFGQLPESLWASLAREFFMIA